MNPAHRKAKTFAINILVLLAFAAFVAFVHISPADTADQIECTAPYIIDGDTLDCAGTRIRLAGIDAPEMRGHCKAGRKCTEGDPIAARAALVQLTRTEIKCTAIEIDRYGRTIAQCNAADVDLSCAMIAKGHAVARYRQFDCAK